MSGLKERRTGAKVRKQASEAKEDANIRRLVSIELFCEHLLDRSVESEQRGYDLIEYLTQTTQEVGARIGMTIAFALLEEWVPGLGKAARKYTEAFYLHALAKGDRIDFEECLTQESVGPCYDLARSREPVTVIFLDDDDTRNAEFEGGYWEDLQARGGGYDDGR